MDNSKNSNTQTPENLNTENLDIENAFLGSRSASFSRATKETKILVAVNLNPLPNQSLICDVDTGIGFFNHMLEAFGKHSAIHLKIKAQGDLHIDAHHTVEDVGICLGACVLKCIQNGNQSGLGSIERFGEKTVPLDEALCRAVIDFSGRGSVHYFPLNGFETQKIGQFDTALVPEFFGGFVSEARCTLHLDILRGRNAHHMCEALFKAFAKACQAAWKCSERKEVPSTKGSLEGIL
jgi:imidazoleglycerol-phosphate dehydratase